jgi:hypothetical protein
MDEAKEVNALECGSARCVVLGNAVIPRAFR